MVSTVRRMRRASRSCLVPKIARTRKLNIPVSYLTPSPAEDRRSHGTAAVAEQLAGVPARRLGDALAAQHPGQLLDATGAIQCRHRGARHTAPDPLLHHQVVL